MSDGRLVLFTYTPLIGGGYDRRGQSVRHLPRRAPFVTETEAHFPQEEACRVIFRRRQRPAMDPNDGWVIGWRDRRYSDALDRTDGIELSNGNLLLLARTERGCVYRAESDDRGATWWPGARPTALCSSYSPGVVFVSPAPAIWGFVWNQLSRPEILRGLRRSRLSSAVSLDEGGPGLISKTLPPSRAWRIDPTCLRKTHSSPSGGRMTLASCRMIFRAFNYARGEWWWEIWCLVGYEELNTRRRNRSGRRHPACGRQGAQILPGFFSPKLVLPE